MSASSSDELLFGISSFIAEHKKQLHALNDPKMIQIMDQLLSLDSDELLDLHQTVEVSESNQKALIGFLKYISEYEYFADAVTIVEKLRLSAPSKTLSGVEWNIELMLTEAETLLAMGAPQQAKELVESLDYELSWKANIAQRVRGYGILGRALNDMSLPIDSIEILSKAIDLCCTTENSEQQRVKLYLLKSQALFQYAELGSAKKLIGDFLDSSNSDDIRNITRLNIQLMARHAVYMATDSEFGQAIELTGEVIAELSRLNTPMDASTLIELSFLYNTLVQLTTGGQSIELINAIFDHVGRTDINNINTTHILFPLLQISCDQGDQDTAVIVSDRIDLLLGSGLGNTRNRKYMNRLNARRNCLVKLQDSKFNDQTLVKSLYDLSAFIPAVRFKSRYFGEHDLHTSYKANVLAAEAAIHQNDADIEGAISKTNRSIDEYRGSSDYYSPDVAIQYFSLANVYLASNNYAFANGVLVEPANIISSLESVKKYKKLQTLKLNLAMLQAQSLVGIGQVALARRAIKETAEFAEDPAQVNIGVLQQYLYVSAQLFQGTSEEARSLLGMISRTVEYAKVRFGEVNYTTLAFSDIHLYALTRLTSTSKEISEIDSLRLSNLIEANLRIVNALNLDSLSISRYEVNVARAYEKIGQVDEAVKVLERNLRALDDLSIEHLSIDMSKAPILYFLVDIGPRENSGRYIDRLEELFLKYYSPEASVFTDLAIKKGILAFRQARYKDAHALIKNALNRELDDYKYAKEHYHADNTFEVLAFYLLEAGTLAFPMDASDGSYEAFLNSSFELYQKIEEQKSKRLSETYDADEQIDIGMDRIRLNDYSELFRRFNLVEAAKLNATAHDTYQLDEKLIERRDEAILTALSKKSSTATASEKYFPDIGEIQGSLDANTVVTVFLHNPYTDQHTMKNELYTWVVEPEDSTLVIASESETLISDQVDTLLCGLIVENWTKPDTSAKCRQLLAAPIPSESGVLPFDIGLAKELYDRVIKPIEERIHGKELYAVRSGKLLEIPLEVLVVDEPLARKDGKDGELDREMNPIWFIDTNIIIYYPNLHQIFEHFSTDKADKVERIGDSKSISLGLTKSGDLTQDLVDCAGKHESEEITSKFDLIQSDSKCGTIKSIGHLFQTTLGSKTEALNSFVQLDISGELASYSFIYIDAAISDDEKSNPINGVSTNLMIGDELDSANSGRLSTKTIERMKFGAATLFFDTKPKGFQNNDQVHIAIELASSFIHGGLKNVVVPAWHPTINKVDRAEIIKLLRSPSLPGSKGVVHRFRDFKIGLRDRYEAPPSMWANLIMLGN